MWRSTIGIAVIVLILGVLVGRSEAGRTIKKHSAIPKKPVAEVDSENGEAISTEESSVISVPVKAVSAPESDGCGEDISQCKKKPVPKTKNTAMVAPAVASAHPMYQQRPPTLYDLHYRHRLRNASPIYSTSQQLLPRLQRASLEMARGIFSGLGWDVDGWEMILLETILKTITKDLLVMFQMFF